MDNYCCLQNMIGGFNIVTDGLTEIESAILLTDNSELTEDGENIVFIFAQFKKELERLYINYAATVEEAVEQVGIHSIGKERSFGKGGE